MKLKLTISTKGIGNSVTVAIESTAKVSDLLFILYSNRDQFLEHVSFEAYQKIVVVHLNDVYSEHFKTPLNFESTLNNYNINEASTLTLDYSNQEQYFLAINACNKNAETKTVEKIRMGFFTEETTVKSYIEAIENSESLQLSSFSPSA